MPIDQGSSARGHSTTTLLPITLWLEVLDYLDPTEVRDFFQKLMSDGRSTLLPPALPKAAAKEYEGYKKDFIYALKWHLGAIPASVKTLSKILPDILHEKWLFHCGRIFENDVRIDRSEVLKYLVANGADPRYFRDLVRPTELYNHLWEIYSDKYSDVAIFHNILDDLIGDELPRILDGVIEGESTLALTGESSREDPGSDLSS